MTSGFGPSDQECLWLYRKLIFLRRITLCHALNQLIHAFASPAEKKKRKKKKKRKTNYALKGFQGSRLMNGAKEKGQVSAKVSLGYFQVKACGFFLSLRLSLFLFSIAGFRCRSCNRLDAPLDLSRHDLPGNLFFLFFLFLFF